MAALVFRGSISGIGTTSGVRLVVGSWIESPYAVFADVMVAEADGTRRLLAPSSEVAAFVSTTYRFDDVEVTPVELDRRGATVRVRAGALDVAYTLGRRTPLGWGLRLVPRSVATATWWSHVTDPVARAVLPGVRTRGSAGAGRTEAYGATDNHAITGVAGTWRGRDLGALAPLVPDPAFGFGSAPRRPSLTTLCTTVVTGPEG